MKTIDLRRFWIGEVKSLFEALFVAIVATCALVLSSAVFGLIIPVGTNISRFIAYITYDLIIASGCYVLCMKNPHSFWFVPIVCNVTGIVSAIVEPNFWVSSTWILVVFGWMISAITSMWGHDIGIEIRKDQMHFS
jgi:hypothetical protein